MPISNIPPTPPPTGGQGDYSGLQVVKGAYAGFCRDFGNFTGSMRAGGYPSWVMAGMASDARDDMDSWIQAAKSQFKDKASQSLIQNLQDGIGKYLDDLCFPDLEQRLDDPAQMQKIQADLKGFSHDLQNLDAFMKNLST